MQNSLIEQQIAQLTLGDVQWIHNLSIGPECLLNRGSPSELCGCQVN